MPFFTLSLPLVQQHMEVSGQFQQSIGTIMVALIPLPLVLFVLLASFEQVWLPVTVFEPTPECIFSAANLAPVP